MNRPITLVVLLALVTTPAIGADVELSILSNGQRAIRVPPGTTIEFVVSAQRVSSAAETAKQIASVEVSARLEWEGKAIPVTTRPLRIPTTAQEGRFPISLGAVAGPDAPGTYRLRLVAAQATVLTGGKVGPATVVIANDLIIEIATNALAVMGSDPPTDAIDARQPGSPDGTRIDGWDRVTLLFSRDGSGLTPADFAIEQSAPGRVPQVERVIVNGSRVIVELDAVVTVGSWTRITHIASGTGVRLGHLPGDVNGSRRVTAADILTLLDHMDSALDLPIRRTDMDRNGRVDTDDVLRLLDLINGWDGYPAFLNRSLPDD